jgi:hypothetical protein
MNPARLIKSPVLALWLAAIVAALTVAGCGGSSSTTDKLSGPQAVSGTHEAITLTFWFSGPEYEHANAGSACAAPEGQSMFTAGAPIVASDANGSEGSFGFASLSAGSISVANVGRCSFRVNMAARLGPSQYKFVIGTSDTFTVTAEQQGMVRLGGSHGLVEGVDVSIIAKPE